MIPTETKPAKTPKKTPAAAKQAAVESNSRAAKSARLEMRTTREQRELIDRAAAYSGRSVSDFVLASVQEAALRTIQDHELIRLTAKESASFARALRHPRPPSASLLKAAKAYKKNIGS